MIGGGGSSGLRAVANRIVAHRAMAPAFAVFVAALCVNGLFTLSKIFYIRDLSVYFWPHHQWMHRTLLAGQSPLWDPNPGAGYSTIGDPALHVAFLPTLPLRFLPEIVGFNLSVALPFPIAAVGVFLFARRHASPWASAVAAIAYAASGPILSAGNCNNLAWCVAIVPFVFWTVDGLAIRPTGRLFALLALLFAIELCAGEPVTLFGTAVLATAYAALGAPAEGSTLRERVAATAVVVGSGITGILLAAAQALPLLEASQRSIRGAGLLNDTWSLHPMRLAETVLPFVFGNFLGKQEEMSRWLFALNSRREPYLTSLYVGGFALVLAAAGIFAAKRRGWAFFWCGSIAATLVCAFGAMTPVYPALQKVFPLLGSFRYPTKYALLTMLPFAALVAVGWDGLTAAGGRLLHARLAARAVALSLCAILLIVTALSFTDAGSAIFMSMAGVAADADSAATASWLSSALLDRIPAVVVVIAAALWIAHSGGPDNSHSRFVRTVAVAIFSIDLIVMNSGLNPTIDASLFGAPDWVAVTRQVPTDRVHVAQEFVDIPGHVDEDILPPVSFPDEIAPATYLAVLSSTLCWSPSAWDVRQSISQELTGLRPREYLKLLETFTRAERSEQFRFLRLTGTRYALVSQTPPPPSREIMPFPQLAPMAFYELGDVGPRARVMTGATVEPDTDRAIAALFDPMLLPGSSLVVSAKATAAGQRDVAAEPNAIILSETTTTVTVRASAPEDNGYLVLFDSYDPGWTVTVDGELADVVRAWGVYRAVRLASGTHTVVFRYVSWPFRIGLILSIVTGLVLVAVAARPTRRRYDRDPGDA